MITPLFRFLFLIWMGWKSSKFTELMMIIFIVLLFICDISYVSSFIRQNTNYYYNYLFEKILCFILQCIGCPNKHRNSMTNSKSSFEIILRTSIVIPTEKAVIRKIFVCYVYSFICLCFDCTQLYSLYLIKQEN